MKKASSPEFDLVERRYGREPFACVEEKVQKSRPSLGCRGGVRLPAAAAARRYVNWGVAVASVDCAREVRIGIKALPTPNDAFLKKPGEMEMREADMTAAVRRRGSVKRRRLPS